MIPAQCFHCRNSLARHEPYAEIGGLDIEVHRLFFHYKRIQNLGIDDHVYKIGDNFIEGPHNRRANGRRLKPYEIIDKVETITMIFLSWQKNQEDKVVGWKATFHTLSRFPSLSHKKRAHLLSAMKASFVARGIPFEQAFSKNHKKLREMMLKALLHSMRNPDSSDSSEDEENAVRNAEMLPPLQHPPENAQELMQRIWQSLEEIRQQPRGGFYINDLPEDIVARMREPELARRLGIIRTHVLRPESIQVHPDPDLLDAIEQLPPHLFELERSDGNFDPQATHLRSELPCWVRVAGQAEWRFLRSDAEDGCLAIPRRANFEISLMQPRP